TRGGRFFVGTVRGPPRGGKGRHFSWIAGRPPAIRSRLALSRIVVAGGDRQRRPRGVGFVRGARRRRGIIGSGRSVIRTRARSGRFVALRRLLLAVALLRRIAVGRWRGGRLIGITSVAVWRAGCMRLDRSRQKRTPLEIVDLIVVGIGDWRQRPIGRIGLRRRIGRRIGLRLRIVLRGRVPDRGPEPDQ